MASSGTQLVVHLSIDHLPPEILGKIFGLLAGAATGCRPPYTTWFKSTFNFTLVSRHWRLISLSTPHIWGTLVFCNKSMLSLMLERSKMADLSIKVDSHSIIPLAKKVINEQTSRIAEMTVRLGAGGFSELLELEMLKQRPGSLRLRQLHLFLITRSRLLFPNVILVPDRLQVLETYGYNLAWEPLQSFPRLTILTIIWATIKVDLPEFIAALDGMPALRDLHILNSLPSEPPDVPVRPAHIASLRWLHIVSTQGSSQISNFLSLITVPAETKVRILCVADLGRGSSCTALASVLALTSSLHSFIRGRRSEDDDGGGHYKSVWACTTGGGGLRISASRTDHKLETDWPDNKMEFELIIQWGYSPEDTLRKMLPSFIRDKILSLNLGIGLCTETLLDLSNTLPSLRHIVLGCESMPNFIAFLTLAAREKIMLPFRNLRCVCLYQARFTSSVPHGLAVCELEHFLEERSRSGAKLERLVILGCSGIWVDDIRRLLEIGEVEWDGIDSD